MTLIFGLDEAGKGPIIGPMVLAAVAIEEENKEKLESLPIKDSKLLSKKQREELYDQIIKVVKSYKILIVTPEEIDNAVDGNNELNLNWLEAHKTADIINELNPDEAFIDCPSPNITKYQTYLFNLINNKKLNLVCSHKAESLFKVVAAASILAKVTRDREVEKIQKTVTGDIGSGYPADPLTKKFIKENFEIYPNIMRKSWATYKKLVNNKKQQSLEKFKD